MDCSSSDDNSEIIGGIAALKPPKKKKKKKKKKAPANPDKSVSKHPPPEKEKGKKKKKKKNMKRKDMDEYDDGGGKMPAAQTKSTSVRIMVKTRFGPAHILEIHPPGSIVVGVIKNRLVQNEFIREQHRDVINFIDAQTRILLKDGDTIEGDIQGVYVLYMVFGTDPKHTGAILPQPDIYKPTCKNSFPSVAAASAAGASSTNDGKVEETIPSYFQVSGVFTQEKGYHQIGKTSTLSVPKNCQCTYLQTFCVSPQLVDSIRGVEGGGSEFADLLLCVKIGESGSVKNAFKKFSSKRTGVCFAQQAFVMILHKANSKDVESALHTRFALKKGNVFGEFYGTTELDIHDTIAHFEHFPDAMIVFGTTKFTACTFGEKDYLPGEKGRVYRVWYKWNDEQSKVIDEVKKEHGNKNSSMPITNITCNAGDFCRALVATKIGMFGKDDDEDLKEYLRIKLLWANGMVPDVAFNFIPSANPRSDERNLHNLLQSSNVHGEWFDKDARPNPLTVYGPLFGDKPTMASRSSAHYWLSKNALCRFIDVYGTLTYRLAWELINSGAVSYDADGPEGTNKTELLSDFEDSLLQYLDPVDKTPTRDSVLCTDIKTNLLAGDYNNSDNTVTEKSMKKAKRWIKCVKVKLGNKDTFVAVSVEDAMKTFTNIFGEGKKELAEQFCDS
mmetsp:Transcript_24909/g.38200  ORF Transcript_24909/g.38200 Transcript_24909/m.38200 type:complete len:671 (-) Transcript_24909:33-2045(-)